MLRSSSDVKRRLVLASSAFDKLKEKYESKNIFKKTISLPVCYNVCSVK